MYSTKLKEKNKNTYIYKYIHFCGILGLGFILFCIKKSIKNRLKAQVEYL